jgi:hypothetical protein
MAPDERDSSSSEKSTLDLFILAAIGLFARPINAAGRLANRVFGGLLRAFGIRRGDGEGDDGSPS